MVIPLLSTKYHTPPIILQRIERPHLLQKLDEGLHSGRRLILVCAPAGYGKTTLVLDWVHHLTADPAGAETTDRPVRVAWLACEQEDSDLARFLSYLVAALQQAAPGIGEGLLATFHASKLPTPATLATLLINQMAELQEQLMLVLEDFHTIVSQPILDFLTFLIEHQPPSMTLVIVTRADPLLPLARLRGRSQLEEIRQNELLFTPEEAFDFLRQTMGVAVTRDQLMALEKRTEGWPAGLQLAALAMRTAQDTQAFIDAFSGEHQFIADYLANEVLAQQSDRVQSFLLKTSILERLSVPLCVAVTGDANSLAILDALREKNLFLTTLDQKNEWFRYHALFADLLRNRLYLQHPALADELHRRASRWYQEQGLLAPAVEHAFAGHDVAEAAILLERLVEPVFINGQVNTLLRWLEMLPDEMQDSHPLLWIFHDLALAWSGRSPATIQPFSAVQTENLLKSGLSGEAHTVEALLALTGGKLSEAARLAQDALRDIPPQRALYRCLAADTLGMAKIIQSETPAAIQAFEELVETASKAGYAMFEIIALTHLAGLHLQMGRLNAAANGYQRALDLAVQKMGRCSPVAGNILLGLGEVARERNDLDGALQYFAETLELFSQFSEMGLPVACLSMARVKASQGLWNSGQEYIDQARAYTQASKATRLNDRLVDGIQARFWIAQGDLDSAARWAREGGLIDQPIAEVVEHAGSHGGSSEFVYVDYMTLARLYLAEGKVDAALEVIESLLVEANRKKSNRRAIHLLVLKALALQQKRELERAVEALQEALEIAAPEGYRQVFLDEGEAMAQLLYQAIAQGRASLYAKKVLAGFKPSSPAPVPGEIVPPEAKLLEPLSKREMEILALIAAGLSNREICASLHLSLSTVKGHTSNIYGKLGVKSRTQAVSEAARLKILNP